MDLISIYKNQSRDVVVKLSKEERLELYSQMMDGDIDARNTLINSCLPLVISQAAKSHKKYKKVIGIEDLIQIGNLALAKLIEKYNPEYELSTFVSRIVSNAIIDEVMSNHYNINCPVNVNKYVSGKIIKIKETNINDVDKINESTKISVRSIKRFLAISNIKREKVPNDQNVSKFTINSGTKGCFADILDLLDQHVDSEIDRRVFVSYMDNINKPNKIGLVSKEFNMSTDSVKSIVKSVKKTLKSSQK